MRNPARWRRLRYSLPASLPFRPPSPYVMLKEEFGGFFPDTTALRGPTSGSGIPDGKSSGTRALAPNRTVLSRPPWPLKVWLNPGPEESPLLHAPSPTIASPATATAATDRVIGWRPLTTPP